jgi:3-hydroxyisobutyrate dehydrogenase
MRIGVVGLGNMGLPLAKLLSGKGFDVIGCDTSSVRRASLGRAVDSIDGLVDRQVVLLSLPGPVEVDLVVRQLVRHLPAEAAIVDTSTVGPDTTRTLQPIARKAGIAYVDAPVSGGAAGAAAGTLLVMAGGEPADVGRVEPVLAAIARKIVRCGGPGAGNVVKLVNNLMCAGNLMLMGEALRLAGAGGVATADLLEALNAGSGGSRISEVNVPRWIASGSFDSGFTMGLMAKDVRLAAGLAGAGALSDEVLARWQAATAALGGDADFNRVVEVAL